MVKERQRAEGRRKGYKKGDQEQRGYKVDGERKVGAGAFQVYEPRLVVGTPGQRLRRLIILCT